MREAIGVDAAARTRAFLVALLAGVIALTAMAAAPDADAKKKKKPVPVKVMTRNIFLGADLGPALAAANFHDFIEGNGAILREVDLTDFPRRAKGLAAEIAAKKPDLIGLQEAAMWRTGPVAIPPTLTGDPFGAVNVEYDFVETLRTELAALGMSYSVAVSKDEFDFEAPADENDVDNDAPPGTFNSDPTTDDEGPDSLDDAELNGRLTMRDVILVNDKSKVKPKVKNPQTGTYDALYTPNIAGIDIPVTRGWTAVDVTVQKGKKGKNNRHGKKAKVSKAKFRFVNSHFEAFDDETQVPSIRAQQAAQLLATGANAKKVVLLGDFNSDVPGVQPGDEQAYQTLLNGGFTQRSVHDSSSCCVSDLFTSPSTEFDHQVDHIMSNSNKVKLVNSSVTGTTQVNGIYNSDHAGVFSKLKIKK